jgi:hypothetical protein
MSRQTLMLPQTASWDLVVTSSGVNILVVPHGVSADRVIAADDGVVLDGASPIHLMGSGRAVPYIRREPQLVLVQAGGGSSTETVVPVVIHNGTVHARSDHDQSAAA